MVGLQSTRVDLALAFVPLGIAEFAAAAECVIAVWKPCVPENNIRGGLVPYERCRYAVLPIGHIPYGVVTIITSLM